MKCTSDTILFNCHLSDQVQGRSFHLINEGAAEALFNFPVEHLKSLNIDPQYGTIKAGSKVRIVVTYSSHHLKRYYYKSVKCYILYHVSFNETQYAFYN